MKKTIKRIVIFIIICILSVLIFDGYLLKRFTIKSLEKATNREVYLEKASISYFPHLGIEYQNLKIPHPTKDEYLFTTKKIQLDIDFTKLFSKSLIIKNAVLENGNIFIKSDKPIKSINKKTSKVKTNDEKNTNYLNDVLEKLKSFDIKNTTFNTSISDESLSTSSDLIKKSKYELKQIQSEILSDSNEIQYNIKHINIKNIDSIEKADQIKKEISNIKNKVDGLNNNLKNLDIKYNETISSINTLETAINNEYDAIKNTVSFESKEQNNVIDISFINKIIKSSINKFKLKNNEQRKKITGVNYHFNTKNKPKLLIENLIINTNKDDIYITGHHITLNKNYTDGTFNINIIIKNQKKYDDLRLIVNSTDRERFNTKGRIQNIEIPKYKIHNNDEISIHFLKNRSTQLSLDGYISSSSNVVTKLIIENPKYRVINKKATLSNSLINMFFDKLKDQNIELTVQTVGPISNPEFNSTTNANELLNNVSGGLFEELIKNKKKETLQSLQRDKDKKIESFNQNLSDYSDSYNRSKSQSEFQINEIENSLDNLTKKLKQKKTNIDTLINEDILNQPKISF